MNQLSKESLNELSEKVLDCAFAVHRELGPGLFESIYQECLIREFRLRNLTYETAVTVPIVYKDLELQKKFIIDLIVGNEIVLELKSVEAIHPLHKAQLYSYLRLTGKRVGLLLNFNVKFLKLGITRIVNGSR